MKKCLIVVDVQNDFITGALANVEAQKALPTVRRIVDYAAEHDWSIIYTMDTHDDNYLNTQEGHNLPVPHCIEGTWGWYRVEGLTPQKPVNGSIICKKQFSANWQLQKQIFQDLSTFDELVFVGYCSDICVISNVLGVKAAYPEIPITFICDASAGATPEKHVAACEVMRSCQVNVETWDEYLKKEND